MNESDVEISSKVDILIRLVAIGITQGKTQKDQIALLAQAGLQPKMIAEILGTTPNTVSVALSKFKREKRSAATRPKGDT